MEANKYYQTRLLWNGAGAQLKELSVTPTDSLRLWQASSGSDNGVTNVDEPGMQAGQWGAAARETSGVRSNATLDSGRCMFDHPWHVPAPHGRLTARKKIPKIDAVNAQIEVLHAMSASTPSVMRTARLRTSLFSTFPVFYTPENERYIVGLPQIWNIVPGLPSTEALTESN